MTAMPQLARAGTWILDGRGEGRAVRVSRHPEQQLINVSMWRHSLCVGTAHLAPEDAARLIAALSDQLAEFARNPPTAPEQPERMASLERRLADLEEQASTPGWRRAVTRLTRRARTAAPVADPARLTLVP